MIMKRIFCLVIAAFAVNAYTQVEPPKYDWNVTLKIVDESGQPVEAAKAHIFYLLTNEFSGLTDSNGVFSASHHDGSENLAFQIEKMGYYSSLVPYHMGRKYKPEIWNPTRTILLNKLIKPIPMYAKRIDAEPPDNGKPVGYDLVVGDWVGSYGKGINSDILFTREYNRRSLQDYDYKLTVSFPKGGDGIQVFPTPYKNMEGSALRSPHEAPTNGYLSQIVKLNVSHPGQKLIFDYDEKRIYLFRVRTATNDLGNVVSAHYGKIYGDFMQFKYYLNPTPNDRNLEFDPKQNLMTNLKLNEGVSEP
jgi:hypothetical protein